MYEDQYIAKSTIHGDLWYEIINSAAHPQALPQVYYFDESYEIQNKNDSKTLCKGLQKKIKITTSYQSRNTTKAVPSRVHALYLWLEDLEDVMHLYNPFKVHSP